MNHNTDPRVFTYSATLDPNAKCGTCGERYGLHIGQYCDRDPASPRVFTQEPKKVDHHSTLELMITSAQEILRDAQAWPYSPSSWEALPSLLKELTTEATAHEQASHEDSDAVFEAKMKAFLGARGLTVVPIEAVEDGLVCEQPKINENPISLITGNTVQPDPFTAEAAYEAFGHLATPKGLLVVSALGSQRMGCAKWQGER